VPSEQDRGAAQAHPVEQLDDLLRAHGFGEMKAATGRSSAGMSGPRLERIAHGIGEAVGRFHDDVDAEFAPWISTPDCCFSSSRMAARTRNSVCRRTPERSFSTRSTVAMLNPPERRCP
jgi:hypothetical protein